MRIVCLAAVVVAGLLVAACGDDDDGGDPSAGFCANNPAACATPSPDTAGVPGEAADEEAVEILRADPGLAPLLEGRTIGESYWLAPSSEEERPLFGERIALIAIFFREPAQYTGSVPVASDPCADAGEATAVPTDHPCRSQPRNYATAAANWPPGTRALEATVDVDRRAVIDLTPADIPAERIDQLIRFYDQYQPE